MYTVQSLVSVLQSVLPTPDFAEAECYMESVNTRLGSHLSITTMLCQFHVGTGVVLVGAPPFAAGCRASWRP